MLVVLGMAIGKVLVLLVNKYEHSWPVLDV